MKQRPCKFKRWKGNDEHEWIEGVFHEWGTGYEEFEEGPGNYTCAIIELPDGTIEMPMADDIQFLDKEHSVRRKKIEIGKNLHSQIKKYAEENDFTVSRVIEKSFYLLSGEKPHPLTEGKLRCSIKKQTETGLKPTQPPPCGPNSSAPEHQRTPYPFTCPECGGHSFNSFGRSGSPAVRSCRGNLSGDKTGYRDDCSFEWDERDDDKYINQEAE